MADGRAGRPILTSVLERSGYLAELHDSEDPQDETRLENLRRADHRGARVRQRALPGEALDGADGGTDGWDPRPGVLVDRVARAARRRSTWTSTDPELDLAAGAPEPDPSLGAFLERVALVADSDQIPTPGRGRTPGWSP